MKNLQSLSDGQRRLTVLFLIGLIALAFLLTGESAIGKLVVLRELCHVVTTRGCKHVGLRGTEGVSFIYLHVPLGLIRNGTKIRANRINEAWLGPVIDPESAE